MANFFRMWFYVAFLQGGRIRGKTFPNSKEALAFYDGHDGPAWIFKKTSGKHWDKSEYFKGKG